VHKHSTSERFRNQEPEGAQGPVGDSRAQRGLPLTRVDGHAPKSLPRLPRRPIRASRVRLNGEDYRIYGLSDDPSFCPAAIIAVPIRKRRPHSPRPPKPKKPVSLARPRRRERRRTRKVSNSTHADSSDGPPPQIAPEPMVRGYLDMLAALMAPVVAREGK
jgi:hypothetical protein